eukprot:jgi/Bigna1/80276/fgenesh1_pg.69_\
MLPASSLSLSLSLSLFLSRNNPTFGTQTVFPNIAARAEGEENVKLHSLWSTHHTGFPPKALSIEQARLCDTKLQITLKNGFGCAKDPTCQKHIKTHNGPTRTLRILRTCGDKCLVTPNHKTSQTRAATAALRSLTALAPQCQFPGEVKKSKELMQIWNSDAEVESRKAVFGRLHANRQEDVIVMGINKGMLHLWLNWLCGCEDIGIDVKRSTLMVPTDKETYDFIKKLGYYAIKPSWTEKFNVDPVYDGKAGRRGHRWVNDVLLYTCLDLVANGFDVIAQDVDIVWAHDPRPYLREAAKGRDILTSLAPRWDGMGPANTGRTWTAMNMSPIKGKSDQVIHAVSIRKTKRLRADKLLYFNTSCAHYDEKLDPCVDDTEGCIL